MYCKCADSASYFCAVLQGGILCAGDVCLQRVVYVYKEKIVPPYPTRAQRDGGDPGYAKPLTVQATR